jgi:hypothetical protein
VDESVPEVPLPHLSTDTGSKSRHKHGVVGGVGVGSGFGPHILKSMFWGESTRLRLNKCLYIGMRGLILFMVCCSFPPGGQMPAVQKVRRGRRAVPSNLFRQRSELPARLAVQAACDANASVSIVLVHLKLDPATVNF